MTTGSFTARMTEELAALATRIDALRAFLGTREFMALNLDDAELLVEQCAAMVKYEAILKLRIRLSHG